MKFLSRLLVCFLLSGSAFAQYQVHTYVEPIGVWQGSTGVFENPIDALADLDYAMRTYQGGNYIGAYDDQCRTWDVSTNCGRWAFNKKYFPYRYSSYYGSGPYAGQWIGNSALVVSTLCPDQSTAIYYEDLSRARRWDFCRITTSSIQNPGPQPMPPNPFVTLVDPVFGGGCFNRDVTIRGAVVNRCFNILSN